MTAHNQPPITPAAATPMQPMQSAVLTRPTTTTALAHETDHRGAPPAVDPRTAVERVVAYFVQLGVNGDTALRFANTLDARLDPEEIDPARRTAMMLEAFDRWSDELPAALNMKAQADRVAFVAAMHLGRLLNAHPEALEQPEALAEALRPLLDERPHGVLPNLPRQEMHRQPLGELPGVLQGEFWSGTYRWVVPVGASTKRMLRKHKKMLSEADDAASSAGHPPIAAEGPAAGE